MHMGRCCHCESVRLTTIKALNIADGTTEWEYGVGFNWRQHYNLGEITGMVVAQPVTFDAYVIQCLHGQTVSLPNRNSFTLSANAKAALSTVTLNALTGSVIYNAAITNLFSFSEGTSALLNLGAGSTIYDAAALSGGDYVTVGPLMPQIELTDYASNNVTKTYVFHGHTQQAGSITLTTRPSGDTIAWAYNASNATIETTIETSGDVVAATVTGGPWPHSAVNISVEWTSASGDFATASFTASTTVGSSDRPTYGACTTWSPSTGLIANSVGCVFGGYNSGTKLINIFGPTPAPTDAILPCRNIAAGANDSVIVSADSRDWFEGWTVGSSWSQNYTIENNTTTITYPTNAASLTSRFLSTTGNVMITGERRTYAGPITRIGARVDIEAGTITELDHANSDIDNDGCIVHEQDATAGTYLYSTFYFNYTQDEYSAVFKAHVNGIETDANGTEYLLGSRFAYGMDANNIYGAGTAITPTINYVYPAKVPATIGGTSAKAYYWKFYSELSSRMDTGTQFRLRFRGTTVVPVVTGWIDWFASGATIKAAIDAVFPENTEGVTANVTINPFGEPAVVTNTTGLIDRGLEILFAGANTLSYIPTQYLQRTNSITIEIQTPTPVNSFNGVSAWSRSDGSEVWSRPYGDVSGTDVAWPSYGWLRGDFVYVAGPIVDSELP